MSSSGGREEPHPHSLMTSREVDEVVWSYLVESGYAHTAFSLLHESSLGSPNYPSPSNGRKHDSVFGQSVPPGHLVRILQKGLLYLEAEARYRGDPPDPPPRLVGYTIPNALPLPPLPKSQPTVTTTTFSEPPTPGPSTANGKEPTPGPSSTAVASPKEVETLTTVLEPVTAPSPVPSTTSTGLSSKEKGKGKEKEPTTGKRKGRAGSDREDPSTGNEGKRVKLGNSEKEKEKEEKERKKKGSGTSVNGRLPNGTTEESRPETNGSPAPAGKEVESAPTTTTAASSKAGKLSRSASPAQQRSISPSARKNAPTASTTSSSSASTSAASAIAALPSFSRNKSATASTLSTSTLPPKLPPSAPTSPSFDEAALPPVDRRSSLPEGTVPPTSDELMRVKREEAETAALGLGLEKDSDGESEMKVDPPSTTEVESVPAQVEEEAEEGEVEEGVLKVGVDDGLVIRLQGHTLPKVQPCSWNPKVPSLLATGGGDSTCRIWDVPAPGKHGEGTIMKDHIVCKHSSAQRRADVAAVAWDPTGSLLATGSEDGIARIWTPSGDLHLVLSMHQRTIFSLKWNSVGTMLLTGSLDSSVCLWELSNGKVKQQWQTHLDSVLDVDWNDDSTFASASMDKSIHLFSIARVTPVHRFKGHRDEVNVVKFSACGTLVASCSDDKTVRVWSLQNIPGLPLPPKLVVGEENRLIDDEDNGGSFVLEGHESEVHTIAWAPWKKGDKEPRLLASACFDKTAKLWNAEDGTCLHTFSRHTDMVYSLAFSPSLGTYLATGSNDGKMHIWSVKDRKLVLEYEHPGPIYELAWHQSGKQLAVCGRTEDVAAVSLNQ